MSDTSMNTSVNNGDNVDSTKLQKPKPALLPKPRISPKPSAVLRKKAAVICSVESTQTTIQTISSQTVASQTHKKEIKTAATNGDTPNNKDTQEAYVKSPSGRVLILPSKPELPPKIGLKNTLKISPLPSKNDLIPKSTPFHESNTQCDEDSQVRSTIIDEKHDKEEVFSPSQVRKIKLQSFNIDLSPPVRPPRSPKIKTSTTGPFEDFHTNSPTSPRRVKDISWERTKQKSASLPRNDNFKWEVRKINSHSQHPITYLQDVSKGPKVIQPAPSTGFFSLSTPVPHPRHKQKLKLNLELDLALRMPQIKAVDPIYATVDYSKKINRRKKSAKNERYKSNNDATLISTSSIESFKSLEENFSTTDKYSELERYTSLQSDFKQTIRTDVKVSSISNNGYSPSDNTSVSSCQESIQSPESFGDPCSISQTSELQETSENDRSLSMSFLHSHINKTKHENNLNDSSPTYNETYTKTFIHNQVPSENSAEENSISSETISTDVADKSNSPPRSFLHSQSQSSLHKKIEDGESKVNEDKHENERPGSFLYRVSTAESKSESVGDDSFDAVSCSSKFDNTDDTSIDSRSETFYDCEENTGNSTAEVSFDLKPNRDDNNSSQGESISVCSGVSTGISQHSESEEEEDHSSTPQDVRARKAFKKAEELMRSEGNLIEVLKLLNIDFKRFVEQRTDGNQRVIPEKELQKILNHLPELQLLNEDLYSDLKSRIDNWKNNPKIADVIVKKGPFLKLYTTYIQNFESQCKTLEECIIKHPKFGKTVKEFESCDAICRKLPVRSFMLKPVQRITQYRLLLHDYLKYLDVDSPDYEDTKKALDIVTDVAEHANRSMKHGDRISRMIQLQQHLSDYNLIEPGRELIKEGELEKYCRKSIQARYFILLNDCLLYTSYHGSMTNLRVNLSLPLSGMKVEQDDGECIFTIRSVTKSFKLRAKSDVERKEWLDALHTAIDDYTQRQQSFNTKSLSKVKDTPSLGRRAPVWVQDSNVTMCQICTTEFTNLFRRHHCRACGKVVCKNCSSNQAPLQYTKFEVSRVCDDCYKYLWNEFSNKDAFLDVIGETFSLKKKDDMEMVYEKYKNRFVESLKREEMSKTSNTDRLMEVKANDTDVVMSGWLNKYRKHKKNWKTLWFVLENHVLYTFKANADVKALAAIPVLGYDVIEYEVDHDVTFRNKCFQLVHKTQEPIVFCAESEDVAKRWLTALKKEVTIA